MSRLRFALALLPLLALHCGSPETPPGSTGGNPLPPCTDCTPAGDLAFVVATLNGATLWTASPMDKVLREASVPTRTGDTIRISAAKNEFEPFQIIVRPDASATVNMTMTSFTGPGTIDDVRIQRVGYVKITEPSDPSAIVSPYMPDPLHPAKFGTSQDVTANENQPFWITVRVPPGAPAGDYTAKLTVTVGSETTDVPIALHVYNFELPQKIGFDGNWNSSFEALGGGESLDKVRQLKDFFYEHRLVPSGVAWPAGLNYNGGIDYDCAAGKFVEVNNPYDFSQLGPEYIDGQGWNGVGFPSFQIMQFVNNSTPRPQTFCGVDRGPDHYGTTEYNAAWQKLLSAIDAYLVAHNWQDKGYYYVQNEPQGPADYDVAAFLAKLSKEAAPNFAHCRQRRTQAENRRARVDWHRKL